MQTLTAANGWDLGCGSDAEIDGQMQEGFKPIIVCHHLFGRKMAMFR